MDASLPLRDLVVLDLSRVLAGPFCTMLLSDLGARVIKVERPGCGDDAREIGPFVGGESAYFASVNRGKESIALDLTDPKDRPVFEALLTRADVLVENFRPGAMARLGYSFEAVHAINRALVYASVSGFGQSGPDASLPAYDAVVQALGGIMSVTGPEGGPPTRVGTSVADISGGMFAAVGILTCLLERTRTGLGRHVDVAMLDGQVAMLENALARLGATGVAPGPLGGHHSSIAPFGTFQAADGQVVIAAGNDDLFAKCASALGVAQMASDARFASNQLRCSNRPELVSEMENVLRRAPAGEWITALQAAGVPCGEVRDVAQVVADPHVKARNMVVALEGDGDSPLQGLAVAGNPIKLSGVADPPTRPLPPLLDADRAAILSELGLA